MNQNQLECPVCIETLKPPVKILGCGHSFCRSCIERVCRSAEQSRLVVCVLNPIKNHNKVCVLLSLYEQRDHSHAGAGASPGEDDPPPLHQLQP